MRPSPRHSSARRETYSAIHNTVAKPEDLEPLVSMLVLAFASDPLERWKYRDTQRYLAYFGRFVRAFGGKAFSAGTAWRIEGYAGAALWLPPNVKPDEDAIASIVDESVPKDVIANMHSIFEEMEAYHPTAPHWYLPLIGVEPHLRRKRLGTALLAQALKRCDEEHMPAYLESTNPANTPLYQRLGFEPLGTCRQFPPSGPNVSDCSLTQRSKLYNDSGPVDPDAAAVRSRLSRKG
jgi:GNAT superfamily N-acetyltransferase